MTKPEIKKIEITKSILNKGKSINGGWSRKQVLVIGEDMNTRGWKKRLLGKMIEEEKIQLFVDLKDNHLKGTVKEITTTRRARQKEKKRVRHLKKDLKTMVKPSQNMTLKEQYAHPNWQRVRIVVLNRDEFTCKYCGNEHEQLHVHHLKYNGAYIWDTEIRFLVSVCKTCHKKQHKHMK